MRGPRSKTLTTIVRPVHTFNKSSTAEDWIGGILVGVVVLSPIWVPLAIVNKMYQEWHPVPATLAAVPFLTAVIALYIWIADLMGRTPETVQSAREWLKSNGSEASKPVTQASGSVVVATSAPSLHAAAMKSETEFQQVLESQVQQVLASSHPGNALREVVNNNMQAFPFPKGTEEYDDEMMCNQYELAANVKRALTAEWHAAHDKHDVVSEECVEEREKALKEAVGELFSD